MIEINQIRYKSYNMIMIISLITIGRSFVLC